MLLSPAICNECGVAFPSSEVVAEHHGDPASYRASAGPCPECGSRGSIPQWIFSFHTAAAAARDQATVAQNADVLGAVRALVALGPAADRTTFLIVLTDAWRGVASALRRIPQPEWDAALAMLNRMLEHWVPESRLR